VANAGSVGSTFTAGWGIGWEAGFGVGLRVGLGAGSGVGSGGRVGPGFESTGDDTERAFSTGAVSTDGVVTLGTGSATLPLIIVTLSAVLSCDVWEGCSVARASPAASTKTTKHKASATAKATIFQVNRPTRLVVILATLRYKPWHFRSTRWRPGPRSGCEVFTGLV
jgi:hypothetical protein